MKAVVYCPTRGQVYHQTALALDGWNVNYVRDNVSVPHARNWIVRDFLQSDGDVLVMVDDDVIPPPGWHSLIRQGLETFDVVGLPYPMSQAGSAFFPAVFTLDNGTLVPLDDIPHELVACDAVGTGCIAIKRAVLEYLAAPFNPVLDEDGVIVTGEDFAFCERAREAGFTIGAHFGGFCDHFCRVHSLAVATSYARQAVEA